MNRIQAPETSFKMVRDDATFTGNGRLETADPKQKNHASLTRTVAYKRVATHYNHFFKRQRTTSPDTECPPLKIPFDTFEKLKEISDYFDNKTILEIGPRTLCKHEDYFQYNSSKELNSDLCFVIGKIEYFEYHNFDPIDTKDVNTNVRFISSLLKFEPKVDIKEKLIKHLSKLIPQQILHYTLTVSILGQEQADEQFRNLFLQLANIFLHPGIINAILNQMDLQNCSPKTIKTMATKFFYNLEEINLEDTFIEYLELMALVDGIEASNNRSISKIVLGDKVKCDNKTALALTEIAKNLSHLHLGPGVTCDNGAVMAFAEKAHNLSHLHLGPGVTYDNGAVMAFAEKASSTYSTFT